MNAPVNPALQSLLFVPGTRPERIAKALAARTGDPLDANRECLGQGLANLCAGLGGGMVVCGSLNRSLPNLEAGARTPLAGAFSGLLAGLRFGRMGGKGADEEDLTTEADSESGALDDDLELGDLGELCERSGEDALAGGSIAGRGRGAGLAADPESRPRLDLSELPELDDTETPEVFFNLAGPASRRLLN